MRYFGCGALCVGVTLWGLSMSGCGYLPSEMEPDPKTDKSKPPEAVAGVYMHAASCATRAKGYKLLNFEDLYDATGDPRHPFRPAAGVPNKYDVRAYVWGYDNCLEKGTCQHGDHYWLINRGPDGDFSTWVVTPQFPRITIESRCKDQLKVGKRYRLSFDNGKLVGFSLN
ncbi:hypothetical protein [Microbulbifer hydrolyticus]|uniref:Lipoprotein n=1 Tax=Microbulbifer hydrolyticus TaxID=48074 RepID=A0A6P1TF24_9GAMM|nr:hypothetical protein [Microbulbifer hydrolyticus]MBB5212527.1 hypothetical protein [Microbulbifer hydrolyticus]QHQ40150.1 hypothetical protein GTQ55_14950 [Microbulbifer hydrolyticus]